MKADDAPAAEDTACEECRLGFTWYPEVDLEAELDRLDATVDIGLSVHPDGGEYTCRRCKVGHHTYGGTTPDGFVNLGTGGKSRCTVCPQDEDLPDESKTCLGGACRSGHVDDLGSFCGSCVAVNDDRSTQTCGEDQTEGPPMPTCGYFKQGSLCTGCANPLIIGTLSVLALTAATFCLTWSMVKGFTKNATVGRAEGGMDFTKSLQGIFGLLQRLTAVMVLPFGWPTWLVQLCHALSSLVSFDLPGLAAPECQVQSSQAAMQLTRITISALALPIVWTMIFVELIFIRFCTKLGKRKAQRGVPLFKCDLFWVGKVWECEEGAFEHVVVTMHGLLFLAVCSQAVSNLVCLEVEAPPGYDETLTAMAMNPAVYCEREANELLGWSEDDAANYRGIENSAYLMLFVYCFLMSFLHWSVRVEYVQIWNKLMVVMIANFWSSARYQLRALVRLQLPS